MRLILKLCAFLKNVPALAYSYQKNNKWGIRLHSSDGLIAISTTYALLRDLELKPLIFGTETHRSLSLYSFVTK